MTRIGKFLRVEDMGIEWAVFGNDGSVLGAVKWYPRWRRHVLCECDDAIFSWDCLRDLSAWLRGLDEERETRQLHRDHPKVQIVHVDVEQGRSWVVEPIDRNDITYYHHPDRDRVVKWCEEHGLIIERIGKFWRGR